MKTRAKYSYNSEKFIIKDYPNVLYQGMNSYAHPVFSIVQFIMCHVVFHSCHNIVTYPIFESR